MKNSNTFDSTLIKLSFAAILLFIITTFNVAMEWIHSVKPWFFLLAAVILAIRPLLRHLKHN